MKRIILNIVLFAFALCINNNGYAQRIRTVAGNNTLGYSGDGGAAVHSSIGSSWGVTSDAKGNLYLADDDDNVVRKIKPDGTIITIAGTGYPGYSGDGAAATGARLNYPSGLAADSYGNLYIADNANFAVRKIDTNGIITTVAGDGSRGNTGDGGPAVSARLEGCVAISFDRHQNMYIADGNTRVRKVNTSGIISTIAGSSMWGYGGDGAAATAAALSGPCGVAVDSVGNIYIADQLNNVIRKVNTSGIISTAAGNSTSGYSGDGGPATHARINTPGGIAIDKNGNLFFADEGNNRVRMISTTGNISTVAGDGTASYGGDGGFAMHGAMKFPSALCLNNSGNLFIADRNNYVVREVINHDAVTICANPGNSISEGTTVTFTVPAGGNDYGLTYQWQQNGANVGTNAPAYTAAVVHNGDIITCNLVDPSSSSTIATSDALTMSVTALSAPYVVNNNVSIDISLFPNPNQGSFEFKGTIHSLIDEYVNYGVYDITGRLLYNGGDYSKNKEFHSKINTDNTLPTGQYTLVVSASNGNSIAHFEICKK